MLSGSQRVRLHETLQWYHALLWKDLQLSVLAVSVLEP
jgi:hypothetical protein